LTIFGHGQVWQAAVDEGADIPGVWTALAAGRQEDGREMSGARHGDVSVGGRILDVNPLLGPWGAEHTERVDMPDTAEVEGSGGSGPVVDHGHGSEGADPPE
jgi:hypothetical protein